jgi:hypothetical protein
LFHCQRARCLQANQETAVALYTIEKAIRFLGYIEGKVH